MNSLAVFGIFPLWIHASFALAGGLGDGGGKSVVCRNIQGKIESAQMLDLFEGEQIRGITYDASLLGSDEWVTAKNIIVRIAKWDQVRAKLYGDRLSSFLSESRFLTDSIPNDSDDSNSAITPLNCKVEQAALQRKPQFPQDPFYLVSKEIFSAMPVRDRAALLMHEIIYRETRALGEKDSVTARYFNSLISSDRIAGFGMDDYQALLAAAKFPFEFLVHVGKKDYFVAAGIGDFFFNGVSPSSVCGRHGFSVARIRSEDGGIGKFFASMKDSVENILGTDATIRAAYSSYGTSRNSYEIFSFGPGRGGRSEFDHVICAVE